MTHRAGLVREPPVGSYFDSTQPPLAEVVRSLNATELVYALGTHTKYSNAGDTAVGLVLESLAHKPYTQYLQEAVLQPLGLESSSFSPEPPIMRNLAKGYMWTYDGSVFQAPTFQLGTGPAGNMYSTVMDQARFLSSLFAGGRGLNASILKPDTLRQMFTPQNPDSGYGLGFALLNVDGLKMVGHRGGIYGFSTELLAMLDDKLGVVAITNMDNSSEVTWHVAFTALRFMLAAHASKPLPPLRLTTKIPVKDMRRLAGRYGEAQESVEIIQRNDRLFIEPLQKGARIELRQLGNCLVTDDRNGWGSKIVPVADGIRASGNTDEVYRRVPEAKPSQVPQSWSKLQGEYGWDYNLLYIMDRNNELTALLEMEFAPLRKISENVWEFPADSSYDHEKLTFVPDKSGCPMQVKVGEVVFPRRSTCNHSSRPKAMYP
jgi:CubicO group peptidase (beta-lactamase class C family)